MSKLDTLIFKHESFNRHEREHSTCYKLYTALTTPQKCPHFDHTTRTCHDCIAFSGGSLLETTVKLL